MRIFNFNNNVQQSFILVTSTSIYLMHYALNVIHLNDICCGGHIKTNFNIASYKLYVIKATTVIYVFERAE